MFVIGSKPLPPQTGNVGLHESFFSFTHFQNKSVRCRQWASTDIYNCSRWCHYRFCPKGAQESTKTESSSRSLKLICKFKNTPNKTGFRYVLILGFFFTFLCLPSCEPSVLTLILKHSKAFFNLFVQFLMTQVSFRWNVGVFELYCPFISLYLPVLEKKVCRYWLYTYKVNPLWKLSQTAWKQMPFSFTCSVSRNPGFS